MYNTFPGDGYTPPGICTVCLVVSVPLEGQNSLRETNCKYQSYYGEVCSPKSIVKYI